MTWSDRIFFLSMYAVCICAVALIAWMLANNAEIHQVETDPWTQMLAYRGQ